MASLPYDLQVFAYPENPSEWGGVFRQAAQRLSLDGKRIGVEPRQLRLLEFRYVQDGAPEADYPDASNVLSELRLRKDQAEVEAMSRAVRIAQDALEATIPSFKIEMSEKALAAELVIQLLKHGSDPELPFAPMAIASTRRSSQRLPTTCTPRGNPSADRPIGRTAAGLPVRLNGAVYASPPIE